MPLRLDADPVFSRLLDPGGGYWGVEPDGVRRISRADIECTNILRTRFGCRSGTPDLIDFMPVGRTRSASAHDYVTLNAPGWVVRRMRCSSGRITLTTRFRPRGHEFSTHLTEVESKEGRIDCTGGLTLWCAGEVRRERDGVSVRIALDESETQTCDLTSLEPLVHPHERAEQIYEATRAFWHEWTEYSRYRGPYRDAVLHGALALKLLTHAPSGAILAAPTTSLPDEIGGGGNWGFRFRWIRDATFALSALGSAPRLGASPTSCPGSACARARR